MLKDYKKEYLKSYIKLDSSIKTLQNLITNIRSDEVQYLNILKNNNYEYDTTDINELIDNLVSLTEQKLLICKNILNDIHKMNIEIEKNLLILKYINGYTWEKISEIMNYSLRQVYNIHNSALKHFCN